MFSNGIVASQHTGKKQVVDIVNKLGHSISYYRTCEIEPAQAKIA